MHIKACETTENATRALAKVKMTFILNLGESTILRLKDIIVLM
jgi:hypothetical protein